MRRDVEINAEGTTLRGWLYLPDRVSTAVPAVVMAHGFSAVKEMYLDRFAEVFAEAGMATLVFDNRNFGASDGEPRQEIDPWQQVRDYRHAITWIRRHPQVNARSDRRMGIELQRRPRSGRWRDRSAGQMRGLASAAGERFAQFEAAGAGRHGGAATRAVRRRSRGPYGRRVAGDDSGGDSRSARRGRAADRRFMGVVHRTPANRTRPRGATK